MPMSLSGCEYCTSLAAVNLGELWLCQPHANALEEYAGGLADLLEMSPSARRAVADAVLSRLVREEALEPSEVEEP